MRKIKLDTYILINNEKISNQKKVYVVSSHSPSHNEI